MTDTLAFLVAWRRILSGSAVWTSAEVDRLRLQSQALQSRARELGVGGLAHHLKSCDHCLVGSDVDRAELSRRLRNVSELTSQLRQELDPSRRSNAPRATAPSAAPLTPPSGPPTSGAAGPPGSRSSWAMPRPVSSAPAVQPGSATPRAPSVGPIPRPASTPSAPKPEARGGSSAPSSPAPPERVPAESATPPPPVQSQPQTGAYSTGAAPPLSLQPTVVTPSTAPDDSEPVSAPALRTISIEATPAAAVSAAPAPPPPSQKSAADEAPASSGVVPFPLTRPSRPPLDTLVGVKGEPERESSQPAHESSQPAHESSTAPVQDANGSTPVAPLVRERSTPRAPLTPFAPARVTPVPRTETRSPPPGVDLSGSEGVASALSRDLELRRQSSVPALAPATLERTLPAPLQHPLPASSPGGADDYSFPGDWNRPRSRWWYGPLLLGVAGAVFVLWRELAPKLRTTSEAEVASAPAPVRPPAQEDDERLAALLRQVHAYGSTESPELRDLIDREAAALGRALAEPCAGPAACARVERARALLDGAAPAAAAAAADPGTLGSWLTGLTLPGIGLTDAPMIRERTEFHTRAAMGREAFQVLLFQCAADWPLLRDALTQHELPLDLAAVPMAESGCLVDVERRSGARGVWQLSPDAALAYHLRIEPEVIDERVSVPKASRAASKLLADLHTKLGSWELALASYDLGPFALVAGAIAGEPERDLWRLAAGGRVGEETARYVGNVQAFALILANLAHYDFRLPRSRPGEDTADLVVPAGTRLGVVARAAGTSITHLRELNPELLADRVPDGGGEPFVLRVPRETRGRARQRLPRLIAEADASDRCVPYTFDWGRQRFTKAMASRCEYSSRQR